MKSWKRLKRLVKSIFGRKRTFSAEHRGKILESLKKHHASKRYDRGVKAMWEQKPRPTMEVVTPEQYDAIKTEFNQCSTTPALREVPITHKDEEFGGRT